MKHTPLSRFAVILALGLGPGIPSFATNGMNMEGYGPIAAALGGASFAYDNGTAAIINNPATLGLMSDSARLDVALGILGPKITSTSPAASSNIFGVAANQKAKSTATAFFMPAVGYARRSGNLVYGLGLFGQGGMGCEYDADTWRGLGYNLKNRSEVSVGRLIAPLAYKINDRLQIAATIDFLWAGMDVKMAMSGNQFYDMVLASSQHYGRATGTIVQSFSSILASMPSGTSVDYAYFNFSNGSAFTGEARGYGYGGKVGLLYTPSEKFRFGLTYHGKSVLSDLTSSGDSLSFQLNVPSLGHVPQSLTGDFRVKNFQWPAMLGAGLAWHPTARLMIAADLRQVYWGEVMQDFHMVFTASSASSNGSFAGQSLDAVLFQNWKDQTVLQVGAAYQFSDQLTLRAGFNTSNNPVPATTLNCLFPAIVQDHLTAGLGWKLNPRASIDASFTYGFENSVTNGTGVNITHRQTNLQVMYSYRF